MELPEVRLYEKNSQYGTAKLGLVAYNSNSGELVFDSGRPLARADDSRWAVMGIGPFHSGSVRNEIKQGTGEIDLTTRVAESVDMLKQKR